ncbi:MAG TPA: hypothetical protein VIA45_07755 [Thermoanaerobaculia bacterium]|jgi:uncharacterized membrane protein
MPEASLRRAALLTLCYVPILGVAAFAIEKRDREIRWHARNGLALFLSVAVLMAAATLVSILFPSLGCVYTVTMLALVAGYSLVVILALVKAIQGERLIVPGVSRYAR